MKQRSEVTTPPGNAPVVIALIAVLAAIGGVGYFAFVNTGQTERKSTSPPDAPAAEAPARNVR